MKRAVQLPLQLDVLRLQADVASVRPEEWAPHFNTSYYEGDWSGVALRSTGGGGSQLYADPTKTEFVDTEVLQRCSYLREVLARFECPLLSARLLRLRAGSQIREHKDLNLGFEDGEVRLHIPVFTNPDIDFVVGGERLDLKLGECWYINFNLPHSVHNRGAADRIHLVIDCVLNDWLRAFFPAPVPLSPEESRDNFERFRSLVLRDETLQLRLSGLPNAEVFQEAVLIAAAEQGLDFTSVELQQALGEARRSWIERWVR
jgi:hypothetical protein